MYGLAETIIVCATPAAIAGEVIIIKPLDQPPAGAAGVQEPSLRSL